MDESCACPGTDCCPSHCSPRLGKCQRITQDFKLYLIVTYIARFCLSAPGSELQKRGTMASPEKKLSDCLLGPHSYLILTRYLAAMTGLLDAARRVEATRFPGLALAWVFPRSLQT